MTHIQEKKHAVLGMSSADRWVLCPGSVKQESYYPNTSSKYADWGTAAHELADICIQSGEDAEEHLNRTFFVNGNPYQVDMDMADCVNTYISYVHSYVDPSAGDILLSEESVPIQHITGEEGAEGTSDVIGIVQNGKRMVVIDLKTGQGVKVDAYSASHPDRARPDKYDPKTCIPNRQMTGYAGGALRKYGMVYDGIEEIEIVIVQPRINWVDSIVMTMADFNERVDALSLAAGLVISHTPEVFGMEHKNTSGPIAELPLVAGEKQCKFCRAKGTCTALRAVALEPVVRGNVSDASAFADIDAEGSLPKRLSAAVNGKPEDGETLAQSLRSFAIVKLWMEGVVEERDRRFAEGLGVPGFKQVLGQQGDRKWRDDEEALKALTVRGRLKVEEATTRKVKSPTQTEKLLKDRPNIWSKIAPLITRAEAKPIIVPADDPREEYQIASSADVFKSLSTDEQDETKVSSTLASLLE
ncbi:MAG: DUF2800 domain-containing protein [Casimicrobium sp.]